MARRPVDDMKDLSIRPARTADRDALLELWERSVRATHHFLTEADIAQLRPLVGDALAGDALEVWVLAARDDTPLGFLGLARDKLEALFLDPAHRGAGLGRRLVDHAQGLRRGCALRLDVNEQNPAARAFYERLGFVVEGRSPVDDAGRPFPLLHMRRPPPATTSPARDAG